jgi:hypothetical protein
LIDGANATVLIVYDVCSTILLLVLQKLDMSKVCTVPRKNKKGEKIIQKFRNKEKTQIEGKQLKITVEKRK